MHCSRIVNQTSCLHELTYTQFLLYLVFWLTFYASINMKWKTAVPFHRPLNVTETVKNYMIDAAVRHPGGDGPYTSKVQVWLEQKLRVPKVWLTTSCTHALELSALLLNIQPGDEVIVPSFTYVSTVNPFVLRGARPVFCDVRADNCNIDEKRLEALITTQTKLIVVVHYAGVACDMDEIMAIARRYGVVVVEDNAHGLLGKYKGQYLGSFGALATLSFHETKNISCGEGGALLINDPALVDRAAVLRDKGTNRGQFLQGKVSKYGWVDVGSSYSPSEVLAAMLYGQLERSDEIQLRRKVLSERYERQLADWAAQNHVQLSVAPVQGQSAYHLFFLILPTERSCKRFSQHLRDCGVHAVGHYLPLHSSPMGAQWTGEEGCPLAESISRRLLRLPLHFSLQTSEQTHVIQAVLGFVTAEATV